MNFKVFKEYKIAKRYQEVVSLLIRHGYRSLITTEILVKHRKRSPAVQDYQINKWERIRMLIEDLGPTFVKFGQQMSSRKDMLPEALLKELEKLQDSVAPMKYNQAEAIIEEDLGKPVSEIFKKFDAIPIASASIAQVHKAELFSGEIVAVKVQKADIGNIISTDLAVMSKLAVFLERKSEILQLIRLSEAVDEFKSALQKEMNFELEASAVERFADYMKSDSSVYVPKVFRELSAKKVLTMEFITGIKVSNIPELIEKGHDPSQIAVQGFKLLIKQIFDYGYFHGDPHPGNILVLDNSTICFLDFGLMGTLLPRNKRYLENILMSIAANDSYKLTKTIIELTGNKLENQDIMEERVFDIMNHYVNMSLENLEVAELFQAFFNLISEFELKLPLNFYHLAKSLVTFEAVGHKLDPHFQASTHIIPAAKKIVKKHLGPSEMKNELLSVLRDYKEFIKDVPESSRILMNQMKRGNFKIELEHKGLEELKEKHDQISNRLAFSIVLASLIIGSSLIVLSKVAPLWNGIPLIGIAGFTIASIMGFSLLIGIIKSGNI